MNKLENGVHLISNDDYHASLAISRSGLWAFKKSPFHYWYEYLNPDYQRPEKSPFFLTGELVHTLLLEPDEYAKRYVACPKVDKRTKAGKENWEAFIKEHHDKIVVTEEQEREAIQMYENLLNTEYVKELVEDSRIENSIFFDHSETGLQCKVRPDSWKGTIITDLKTTKCANARSFQLSAYQYGYYLQAGMIYEALKTLNLTLENFVFVCVENQAPYATAVYMLDDDAIDYGVKLFHHLMEKFKTHLDNNHWPGYETQTLSIPRWAEIDY